MTEFGEGPASGSPAIPCPVCSTPTDSLKRYGVLQRVVFLGIAVHIQRSSEVACPKCMRYLLRKVTFSPLHFLLANLMWFLVVLPYHLILMIASTTKGHSSSIRKQLSE
jgi:hypothetical protein